MIALLVLVTTLAADGPDLAAIDQAVAKCDAKLMSKTFADEPQRRRNFTVAAFVEQQAIVQGRQALAARRLAALQPQPVLAHGAGAPSVPADDSATLDREAQALAMRQQELDDARLLNTLRQDALDMMRQQYVSRCSVAKAP